jgi:hypothetical protein
MQMRRLDLRGLVAFSLDPPGECRSLRLSRDAVRLSVLNLLVVTEPLFCGPLSLIALLGVLTTLFYAFAVKPPHFPVWLTLGIFLGFALLRVANSLLVRVFSRRSVQ